MSNRTREILAVIALLVFVLGITAVTALFLYAQRLGAL